MDVENWALIRHLHMAGKLNVSEIARKFNLDRKTVRAALQAESFLDRKRRRRPSLLDPFRRDIDELLDDHPKLSAVRILEELRKRGYQGEYSL